MSKSKDWWPSSRAGQLAMASKWVEVITPNAKAWKIDAEDVKTFGKTVEKARLAFHEVQNEETCTPVAKEKCRVAFSDLETAARAFKKQHLTIPPLDSSIYVSLGLKVPDKKPTPSGTPTAQLAVETYLEGKYELGLRLIYINGSPDDPANKSFRVFYSVVAHGETPPRDQEELHSSFSTTQKKKVIQFKPTDSGKTCYIAAQIENNGKKGPWGPITSAVIP
ncbi:MAG: hypothetical protein FWB99_04955 [Treponema sp.]|nr:hypothetical protein [Treponema sp.]